jgi:hypothetical protein
MQDGGGTLKGENRSPGYRLGVEIERGPESRVLSGKVGVGVGVGVAASAPGPDYRAPLRAAARSCARGLSPTSSFGLVGWVLVDREMSRGCEIFGKTL